MRVETIDLYSNKLFFLGDVWGGGGFKKDSNEDFSQSKYLQGYKRK